MVYTIKCLPACYSVFKAITAVHSTVLARRKSHDPKSGSDIYAYTFMPAAPFHNPRQKNMLCLIHTAQPNATKLFRRIASDWAV